MITRWAMPAGSRAWRGGVGCALVCACLYAWPLLAAEEEVSLEYLGGEGCPGVEDFQAQVRERTNKVRWVPRAKQDGRSVSIRLEVEGGQWLGSLVSVDGDGTRNERSFRSANCADVVAALALTTALMIDPQAGSSRAKPAPTVAASLPPAPKPAATPKPVLADRLAAVKIRRAASRWRWSTGIQVHGTTGFGPAVVPVFPLFVGVERRGRQRLAPSFRLSASVLLDHTVVSGSAHGRVRRWAAQLSGCPVAWWLARELVVRPCAGFEAGALLARAVGVDRPASSVDPWAAAVASARLQLLPMDWLLLELQTELLVPLARPRYVVERAGTVFAVDPVIGTFGASFGVRLP